MTGVYIYPCLKTRLTTLPYQWNTYVHSGQYTVTFSNLSFKWKLYCQILICSVYKAHYEALWAAGRYDETTHWPKYKVAYNVSVPLP